MAKCFIDGGEGAFLLTKDGYEHYRCTRCGLVFVWPQPTEEKLKSEVYSEESGYQKGKTTDDGSVGYTRHTERILEFLGTRYQVLGTSDNPKTDTYDLIPNTLLDVGCSSGDFLVAAKNAGFEVVGVELNPRTGKQAQSRGLSVVTGTLFDAKFESAKLDVVHLGDVIEHVPDPRTLVIECKRILKQGGQLVISTPNTDCLWARATLWLYKMFNIPWSIATPPHHLFLFNSSNLDLLLNECGFDCVGKWCEGPPRLMYELGNTHLFGEWRRDKSIGNLACLIFGFALYSLLYSLNFLAKPFLIKNFGQVAVYHA